MALTNLSAESAPSFSFPFSSSSLFVVFACFVLLSCVYHIRYYNKLYAVLYAICVVSSMLFDSLLSSVFYVTVLYILYCTSAALCYVRTRCEFIINLGFVSSGVLFPLMYNNSDLNVFILSMFCCYCVFFKGVIVSTRLPTKEYISSYGWCIFPGLAMNFPPPREFLALEPFLQAFYIWCVFVLILHYCGAGVIGTYLNFVIGSNIEFSKELPAIASRNLEALVLQSLNFEIMTYVGAFCLLFDAIVSINIVPDSRVTEAVMLATMGHHRAVYRAKHKKLGRFKVIDYDTSGNMARLAKWRRNPRRSFPTLRGHTICGDYTFNFPVYCTETSFRTMLRENRVPRDLTGIAVEDFDILFQSVKASMCTLSLEFFPLVPPATFLTLLQPASLTYAFLEESFNDHFTVFPIILFEAWLRRDLFYPNLLPAAMHLILSLLPFPVRVLLHWLWNNFFVSQDYVEYTMSPLTALGASIKENAEAVQFVSYYADVLLKIYRRDATGLVLSLGIRPNILTNLIALTSSDESTFGEEVLQVFGPSESEEAVVLLGNEESKLFQFCRSILPPEIANSPTFYAGNSMLAALFAAGFVDSVPMLRAVLSNIESSLLLEKGLALHSVGKFAVAVYNGIKRVFESSNFWDFWEVPKDTKFLLTSRALLIELESSLPVERLLVINDKINDLLLEQYKRKVERDVALMREKLEKAQSEVRKRLSNMHLRPAAFPLVLIGPPGTAKSSGIAQICELFSRIDGVGRKDGDLMNYEAQEKYPSPSHIIAKDVRYILVNDIEAVTSDYDKKGLLPLNVAFQKLLDDFPCSLPNAVADKKGALYSNLRFVGITGNHKNYKTGGETERLERRFKSGLCFYKWVRHPVKGTEVDFEEFQNWPADKLNEATRYTRCTPKCSGQFITFEEDELVLDNFSFYRYVEQAYIEHCTKGQKKVEEFHGASACKCGLPVWNHRRGEGLVPLSMLCDVHLNATMSIFQPYSRSRLMEFSLLTPLFYLSYYFSSLYIFFLLSTLIVIWQVARYYVPRVDAQVKKVVVDYVTNTAIERFADRWYPWIVSFRLYGIVRSFACGVHPQAELSILRFEMTMAAVRAKVAFMYYYKYVFGASAVALLALFASKFSREKPMYLGKPIYAEDIRNDVYDPQLRREMNYPDEFVRRSGWAVKQREMTMISLQKVGVSEADIARLAKSATFDIEIHFEDGTAINGKCLALGPQFACFNKHFVCDKSGEWRPGDYKLVTSTNSFQVLEQRELKYDPETELVLFFHHFNTFPSPIFSYLPDKPVMSSCEVSLDGKNWQYGEIRNLKLQGVVYRTIEWDGDAEKGDCSTPILGRIAKGQCFIVGGISHRYDSGGRKRVGGVLLSREWYDRQVAKYDEPHINAVQLLHDEKLGPLSQMSEMRYKPLRSLMPIGSTDEGTSKFRSTIRNSLWHDALENEFSEKYAPVDRVRGMVGDQYVSAWIHTFKYADLSSDLKESEIYEAVAEYCSAFADHQREHNIHLSPLTTEEALLGCPDLGISRIDFKTSTGRPLKKIGIRTKFDFFEECEDWGVNVKDEINKRLKDYWDRLKLNCAVVNISDIVPKDEVRPLSKVLDYKVRLFSVMDALINLIGRALVMPLIVIILSNPEISECYGGMNAGSKEWNALAERLLSKPLHFDADFSSFDTSHDSVMFRAFALVLYMLAKTYGYEPAAAELVYIYCIAFKWQLAKYLTDIFGKFKGMPSGVIITLIMNSIVNSLLMRICYRRLVGELRRFREDVKLATVGDDNVQGVDGDIREKYNMITVSEQLFKLGYIATPARKNNTIQPFIPFSELTFLKRSFRFDEVLGYVAPLEKDSIYKALSFEKKEAGITPTERLRLVAESSQREFFLHGRTAFESFQQLLNRMPGIGRLVVVKMLSYEVLEAEYQRGELTAEMF